MTKEDALTRRITDHETTARRIREEQANMTRAMARAVATAIAGLFRAAMRAVSAGSAAYR